MELVQLDSRDHVLDLRAVARDTREDGLAFRRKLCVQSGVAGREGRLERQQSRVLRVDELVHGLQVRAQRNLYLLLRLLEVAVQHLRAQAC